MSDIQQASTPSVSVVTIAYNCDGELEKTILSVIRQTYKNLQYIILDGGSKDNTLSVIKKFEREISYWHSEPDKGIYFAMNKGMEIAQGEWLIFMNAGDTFKDYAVLEDIFSQPLTPKTNVVFGKSETFYRNYTKLRYEDFGFQNPKWFYDRLPNHQAVFVSRRVYKTYKFDTRYKVSADTVFLRTVFENYGFQFVNRIVSRFELGGTSSYYPSSSKFKRVLIESYNIRGLSTNLLGHIVKFILQKIFPKDLYMIVYMKVILKS